MQQPPVIIKYGPLYSQCLTFSAFKGLDELLTVKDKNSFWMMKRSPGWDGKFHFFTKNGQFLSGFIHKIVAYFKNNNIPFTITGDIPKKVEFLNLPLSGKAERDYQTEAVIRALKHGRGIIKSATGSGKMLITARLMKEIGQTGLYLTHSKALFKDAVERLQDYLEEEIGTINPDGICPKKYTIAMIPTLESRLDDSLVVKYLATARSVFYDECHLSRSSRWQHVNKKIINAHYRFGFSATPSGESLVNNMKLEGTTGKIIFDLKSKFLIDKGLLAKPEVRIIVYDHKTKIKYDKEADKSVRGEVSTNFKDFEYELIVNNSVRNSLICDICEKEKTGVLVFIQRVVHGELLERVIPNSVFIHGSTKNNSETVKKFDRGEIPVLIVSSIIDEGVDITNVYSLILCHSTYSEQKILQRIGRGLRQKKENNTLKVYDIFDTKIKFLNSHAKKRLKIYEQEKFDIVYDYKLGG